MNRPHFEKNIGKVPREAPGLPQSEKAGDENHYDNNTNYVENSVHVSFSFLRVIGFTVEPDAHNITQRKGMREASLMSTAG